MAQNRGPWPTSHEGLFRWRRPRFTAYRAADDVRGWRAGFNRYPGVVIGAFVQLDRIVVGVTWKGSRR